MLKNLIKRRYFRDAVPAEVAEILAIQEIKSDRPIAVYYFSKPIQYLNLLNTPIDPEKYNILICCGVFVGAKEFFALLESSEKHLWQRMIYVEKSHSIFLAMMELKNIQEFHPSSDWGLADALYLREVHRNGVRISLFEEGASNYVYRRHKIFFPGEVIPWWRKWFIEPVYRLVYHLAGANFSMGGCRWVDEVFLNFPDFEPSVTPGRKRRPMQRSVRDNFLAAAHIFENCPDFRKISGISGKRILFFATNWDGKYARQEGDETKYDMIIVKYHPHIREDQMAQDNEKFIFMQNFIPLEILVQALAAQGNQVTMRSDYSSSMIYLANSGINLEFTNDVPDFMRDIVDYLDRKTGDGMS